MMSYPQLKTHFDKYLELNNDELENITSYYQERKIAKGEYLLRKGDICRIEGYVISGCFKVSATNGNGVEKILYFAGADWWVMELDSFANQTASELNIQAIDVSTILSISYSDKEKLYHEVPSTERLFRLMSQKAVGAWQKRVIRNHTLSAEQRYLYFIQTYPDIAKKVSNKQLASYLGITQEFISMIRRRIKESSVDI